MTRRPAPKFTVYFQYEHDPIKVTYASIVRSHSTVSALRWFRRHVNRTAEIVRIDPGVTSKNAIDERTRLRIPLVIREMREQNRRSR